MSRSITTKGICWLAAAILAAGPGCATIGEGEIEVGPSAATNGVSALDVVANATTPDTSSPAAGSWPGWRGAARNGRANTASPPLWISGEALPERWRTAVGEGLAGPVVEDGRVFVHGRQEEKEVVRAFKVASGKELWSRTNTIASWGQPFDARGISGGPIATPCVADGKLYTVGIHGLVQCFDAASGELHFVVHSEALDGAPSEYLYGHCSSPLVVGDLLLVSFSSGDGQLVALDRHTGAVRWRNIEEPITYTSPIVAELHGK